MISFSSPVVGMAVMPKGRVAEQVAPDFRLSPEMIDPKGEIVRQTFTICIPNKVPPEPRNAPCIVCMVLCVVTGGNRSGRSECLDEFWSRRAPYGGAGSVSRPQSEPRTSDRCCERRSSIGVGHGFDTGSDNGGR